MRDLRSEYREEFSDAPVKSNVYRYHAAAIAAVALAAILFQVYVPRFITYLSYLEVPLLITVYFSLMRKGPVAGVMYGALIGLAQDSLSHNPLGMFGIVKTLVGYFAAAASVRFNVENPGIRLVVSLFFCFFHQVLYWVLGRALLGESLELDIATALVVSVLNALVAVPLFHVLDKLRIPA